MNHPGGACWTNFTPEIKPGDLVRFVEKTLAGTTLVSAVAQQTTVANIAITSAAVETTPGTVVVRGTAQDAAGNPLPIGDIAHAFITSTANPFDASGARRIQADSTARFEGVVAYETGINWVATYTGLTAADVARAVNNATSQASWLGATPGAPTDSTTFEYGQAPGPQSPCTAPLAAPVVGTSAQLANFTAASLGSSSTSTITVTNIGGGAFSDLVVSGITGSGDFSIQSETCTAAPIAAAGTCQVVVRFAPTATGARTGTLTINSNSHLSPNTVSLVGLGLAVGATTPFLTTTPSTLDFGTLLPSLSTQARTITVTNIGNAPAPTVSAAVTGLNRTDWALTQAGTCTGTLAANASCTVSLVFSPTLAGARSATLEVYSNALLATTAALTGAGLSTTNVNYPPNNGVIISTFISRDFVSAEGLDPTVPVVIQALRHNVIVGTTLPFNPTATGLAEVNHPGGACWEGTTPDLRGGDHVRVVTADGVVYEALTADIFTAAAVTNGAGTVEVHGRAVDLAGAPLPIDSLGVEIISGSANRFDLNGRRLIGAPGDGTLQYDPIDAVTNPDGLNFTATFTGLSAADVIRATQQSDTGVQWLGRNAAIGSEITAYEAGLVGGPQAPCTAPAAAPDGDLELAPGFVDFPTRQAPRTGFASTFITRDVTVLSTGVAPLVVTGVAFAGANPADYSWITTPPTTCPLNTPIAVGSSCIIRVRFRPKVVGDRTAELQVFSNSFGNPMRVALHGIGAAAAEGYATITPLLRDFPDRARNTQITRNITVRNNGEAPLTVSVGAITGPDAEDFAITANTCTVAIAVNTTCTVTVRFRPLAVGTHTAPLVITPAASQAPITVTLTGRSLTDGLFNDPPVAPRNINVFPVRDQVTITGYEPQDNVIVQVVRNGAVVGESGPIAPQDDPLTPLFDGIVEVNHAGGACWPGVTPDIKPGDVVRAYAVVATPNGTLVQAPPRNGVQVADQTPVQDVVITQNATQTAPGTVVVKGYGRDVRFPGQRLDIGSIEVRIISIGQQFFVKGGNRDLRADANGALQGTVAYDGLTDMWTATFTGLTPADVALALDPTSLNVALWLGRSPAAALEGTLYEWSEVAGPQPPCNAGVSVANYGIGTLAPAYPGVNGEKGLIDFGLISNTAVSTTSTITLTNTGAAAMTVSGIRTDLGLDTTGFKVVAGTDNCTGVLLAVGRSCTVGVQFLPVGTATPGLHAGSVQLYSNGAHSPHQVVLRANVAAAPTIATVSPALVGRTSTATVTGTGLDRVTSVSLVGSNALAGVGTVVSVPTFTNTTNTVVTFPVPVGAVLDGTYQVRITALGGTVTSTASITVLNDAPVFTSFTPAAGGKPGTAVTITGRNFTRLGVPYATAVSFGGVNATAFTVVTDTTITTTVPANGIGGRISVTTPSGVATSTTNFDVWLPPVVTSVNVNPQRPGLAVTLTGSEFLGITALTLNGTAIATRTANAAGTTLTFTLPAAATNGPLVITARGGVGTSNILLVNAAPTITSFTPASAGAGVGAVVTVNGRNYVGVTAVTVGTVAAPFTVVNTNQLRFTVPAGAATGPFNITAAFGNARSATNLTIIAPPTITSFTPTRGGAGVTVPITGTNLATATAVTIGGRQVTTFTTRTATRLAFVTPAGMTPGLAPISVTGPGGTRTSVTLFQAL
ncbi:MAG: choice-of-anchor D domain-containing protein [Actinomycetota bacterium]